MEYKSKNHRRRLLFFPSFVLLIYGILSVTVPDKALVALRSSGDVFVNIIPPLAFVFAVMVGMNLFLKPAQIAAFLGRAGGIKGIALSAAAGIISMGPIYVWYPLLKELRERGAPNTLIAVFLYNRAVKPFLLPVMIAYFGLAYVVILTLMTILGSIVVGYSVGILVNDNHGLPD